jgi:hypothetical protein
MNTVFNNHPLIKNSNQYFFEKKFVSIHSEDRDITKFPNSAEFEIFFPQEYLNVASARLYSWSFPANYSVFSATYYNISITFKFNNLYNPEANGVSNVLAQGIFAALSYNKNNEILVKIQPGFYNPYQMSTELTNKFNSAVTTIIQTFFDENPDEYAAAKALFEASNGYQRFKIVYNSVSLNLWFGNQADQFTLTNESSIYNNRFLVNGNCYRRNQLPEFTNWGLPYYLGFTRCNSQSYNGEEYTLAFRQEAEIYITETTDGLVPRFCYGDVSIDSGDNGYWLLPIPLDGAQVYFLQAPSKINFMGPAYIYMEIEGWNCIDETAPFNLNLYTITNNQNNGIANSSFAKIGVTTTPLSQWFDESPGPYKYWNPPAERISKIKVKFRYHNGTLVEFGNFDYSFMLELNLLKPQQEKSYSIVNAFDLGQQQSFASKYV